MEFPRTRLLCPFQKADNGWVWSFGFSLSYRWSDFDLSFRFRVYGIARQRAEFHDAEACSADSVSCPLVRADRRELISARVLTALRSTLPVPRTGKAATR